MDIDALRTHLPTCLLARLAAIAIVGGLGGAGIAAPHSLLFAGAAWLAFLFFVLSGWGYFVVRATRVSDTDFGQRALYGTAGLLAVAGMLLGLEICNHYAIAALVAAGYVGFVWRELVTPTPMGAHARAWIAVARAHPGWAVLCVVLVVLAGYVMCGAVARFGGNWWDDDVAYNSYMRRLLDLGEINEPFSFRRVSAYGGQTIINATAAIRGTFLNVFLVEHGLFQGLSLLVMIGAMRERKLDPIWQVLLVVTVLLFPDTSINTASYWTGVAGFLALYRVVLAIDRAGGRDAIAYGVIAALLGAAICTLRQNYIPVVVLFLGLFVLRRALTRARVDGWRMAWRSDRGLAIAIVVTIAITLAPYCVAAYVSNQTFLFPMMLGDWNPGLKLTPVVWSAWQEIEFFVWCCVEPHGLVVVIPLFCVMVSARDTRAGKPLTTLFVSVCVSFVLLVHSFTLSDPLNLWRYAFGYMVTLALVIAIEIGPSRRPRVVHASWVARWVLFASLLVQLFETRGDLRSKFQKFALDIRAAYVAEHHPHKGSQELAKHYARLQAAIPVDARVMTMLDSAAYLDFRRNDLTLLDMPGWCAPAPGYPAFQGAEELRRYLTGLGFQYLAFVRPESSVALYRRDGWLQRLFTDLEVSRTMGAYLVDTIDSVTELATRCRLIYDEDGWAVLDLEACR
jgi:hypothetical protein